MELEEGTMSLNQAGCDRPLLQTSGRCVVPFVILSLTRKNYDLHLLALITTQKSPVKTTTKTLRFQKSDRKQLTITKEGYSSFPMLVFFGRIAAGGSSDSIPGNASTLIESHVQRARGAVKKTREAQLHTAEPTEEER